MYTVEDKTIPMIDGESKVGFACYGADDKCYLAYSNDMDHVQFNGSDMVHAYFGIFTLGVIETVGLACFGLYKTYKGVKKIFKK